MLNIEEIFNFIKKHTNKRCMLLNYLLDFSKNKDLSFLTHTNKLSFGFEKQCYKYDNYVYKIECINQIDNINIQKLNNILIPNKIENLLYYNIILYRFIYLFKLNQIFNIAFNEDFYALYYNKKKLQYFLITRQPYVSYKQINNRQIIDNFMESYGFIKNKVNLKKLLDFNIKKLFKRDIYTHILLYKNINDIVYYNNTINMLLYDTHIKNFTLQNEEIFIYDIAYAFY